MSYEEIWKKAAKEVAKERDQYKSERDTLIEDIAVLKANISRLERTVKNKEDEIDWCDSKIEKLARENVYYEKENKALRLQADTYFDEWQESKKNYTTLTNHIRLKAENNPGVS